MRYLGAVALLAACGGNGGGVKAIDAAIDSAPDAAIDAAIDARPDAPPDAPPDAVPDAPPDGPTTVTMHQHYVLDSILVPTNNTEARAYGQDLNGDQTIDNQFGMVLAALGGMGFDLQGATTRSLDRGASITLIDLGADNLTTAAATFAAFAGENPNPPACANAGDTICRHHFTGTGMFTVVTAAPTNPALGGSISAGTYTSTVGNLAAPIAMFPSSAPVLVNLVGARIVATQLSATGILSMKIGGAITNAEMDAKVYPAMHDTMQTIIAKDCLALTSPPTCGCAAGSEGKTWIDLLDVMPHDCAVTIQEIKGSSLIQSLFTPDVVINGEMALSVGYMATAVAASFTAP